MEELIDNQGNIEHVIKLTSPLMRGEGIRAL